MKLKVISCYGIAIDCQDGNPIMRIVYIGGLIHGIFGVDDA